MREWGGEGNAEGAVAVVVAAAAAALAAAALAAALLDTHSSCFPIVTSFCQALRRIWCSRTTLWGEWSIGVTWEDVGDGV